MTGSFLAGLHAEPGARSTGEKARLKLGPAEGALAGGRCRSPGEVCGRSAFTAPKESSAWHHGQ